MEEEKEKSNIKYNNGFRVYTPEEVKEWEEKEKKKREYTLHALKTVTEACAKAIEEHGISIAFDAYPGSWRRNRNWMNSKEFKAYDKRCTKSMCFDVGYSNKNISGGIAQLRPPYNRPMFNVPAKFAVDKHNQDTGSKLEFVKVVKACNQCAEGTIYYLTFEAIDHQESSSSSDQKPKRYHAKVIADPLYDYPELTMNEKALMRTYHLDYFDQAPDPGPVKHRKKKQKSFFFNFVAHLRKQPGYSKAGYREVLKVAGAKWKSMSTAEKATFGKEASSG